MRFAFVIGSALLGLASTQAVTETLTPTAPMPAGCTGSYDGQFEISVAKAPEKRDVDKRGECGAEGILVMTLDNGVLHDSQDRVGYIASNYQFQFDAPPQAGALFTGGFSICDGNVLALGDSKTFYRCLSGDFYNLYDRNWADQCEPVEIVAMGCGGDVGEGDDGQVVGTSVVHTTIVTALSDGQPQVVTTTMGIPMCQIGDGQVQVHTTPCASVPSTAPTSSYIPITQSSDGQIEVPTSSVPAPPPVSSGPPSVTPPTTSTTPAPTYPTTNASMTTAPTPSPSSSAPPVPTGAAVHDSGSASGALVVGFLAAFLAI